MISVHFKCRLLPPMAAMRWSVTPPSLCVRLQLLVLAYDLQLVGGVGPEGPGPGEDRDGGQGRDGAGDRGSGREGGRREEREPMHGAFDQACNLLMWLQPKRLVTRDAPKTEWSAVGEREGRSVGA